MIDLPPAYSLDRGDIVADAGDEVARVHVDCAGPVAIFTRGSDLLVACGDELLTYTTAEDVMRPMLVDRARTSCVAFNSVGACLPYEHVAVETLARSSSPPTMRVRRTALGWAIIGASLGTALVLEAGALLGRFEEAFCWTACGHSDFTAIDIASVMIAVAGPIAGIVVAGTWHDVPRKTAWVPSIEVTPFGGMIGVRVVF